MKIVAYIMGLIALYLALNGLSLMQRAKDIMDIAMGLIAITEGLGLYFVMRSVLKHRQKLLELFD